MREISFYSDLKLKQAWASKWVLPVQRISGPVQFSWGRNQVGTSGVITLR